MKDPIVIVSAVRTPVACFQGQFAALSAAELGAQVIASALSSSEISRDNITETMMGCVLTAGIGQAPARQAALGAGLPYSCGATTINKMCGSGMKAVMLAHDQLLVTENEILIAGGMESMSNAPYLLPKARSGMRLGHQECVDHMFLDGLEDAYDRGKLMGTFADQTARKFQFTRAEQDEFALRSLQRAKAANEDSSFMAEIAPITLQTKTTRITIDKDENPYRADANKIPLLKPAFSPDGTVTAANASSISDGAAALILMRRSTAVRRGYKPLATIISHQTHAQEPAWFTTAPIGAIQKLYEATGWSSKNVDLFEINEAFAVVTMACMKELNIDAARMNIHGGACALGHPIGASGARILVTLIHALQKHQMKRGIAALCIGGGEATAIAIELSK